MKPEKGSESQNSSLQNVNIYPSISRMTWIVSFLHITLDDRSLVKGRYEMLQEQKWKNSMLGEGLYEKQDENKYKC